MSFIICVDLSSGAPDQDTGFRIGSVTKVLTALQTLILRDSSVIESLDQDITIYYPQFKVRNPYSTKRGITFRQLMSHMSGLPRNAPCPAMFVLGCNLTEKDILDSIAGLRLLFPPGSNVAYSNLGFGLLGQVVAHILGISWNNSVSKMVFEPLEMKNSGNTYGSDDLSKIAVGYYPDGTEAGWLDTGWDGPAGQTYSSTADLAKVMFLAFSTNKSMGEDIAQVKSNNIIGQSVGSVLHC